MVDIAALGVALLTVLAVMIRKTSAGVGILQGATAMSQGNSQSRAIMGQAERNRIMAEQDAKDSAIIGARESEQAAWKVRDALGSQRVGIAANGVELSGSALDMMLETAQMGGAEQSAIAQNTARNVWAIQANAANAYNDAKQQAWSAKAQGRTAMATALGGAALGIAQNRKGKSAPATGVNIGNGKGWGSGNGSVGIGYGWGQ